MAKSVQIFVAFPDGVFHYVCRECTTICCRNSNRFDGDLNGELRQLTVLYPALQYVAIQRRGDVITFATPSNQCFFLNHENRCAIEVDHGKALKPQTCSLFPFHSLHRLGRAVVVTPNFLCPLRLEVPPRPGEVEGTHVRIQAGLRASHYFRESFISTIPFLALPRGTSASGVLEGERAFLAACTSGLNSVRFSQTLRDVSRNPDMLEEMAARAAGLIDLDDSLRPAGRDRIDDILLAISPILRVSLTDLSQEAKLRLLWIGELWYRRVLTLTGSAPKGAGDATTAKGAIELLVTALPALRLLALADEPVNLRSHKSRKVPPFADPQMMFEAYRILRSADRAPLKLPILQESLANLPSIAERMAFLVDLGKMLNIDRRK